MAWFGHTQTLTSISKSVTTVASGILGLEDNLATFMKKVIYYDKFFQRVRANLPKEVSSTATLLFARCYEYRSEIRDELESSLAYVADAGRWVVGMEDWTSKMDKRAHQISELVLLANSLLVEYAMTGRLGGDGSKDELDALLRNIAASVVLQNEKKSPSAPQPTRATAAASLAPASVPHQQPSGSSSHASSCAGSTTASIESLSRHASPPHASPDRTAVARTERASTSQSQSPRGVPLHSAPPTDDCESDNDAFNPFACAYKAPQSAAQDSLASSLASLAIESPQSSIPDLATYDADVDARSSNTSHRPRSPSHVDDGSDCEDTLGSPVHLCEYECLDMDAIPKYSVFKPSLQSRMQQRLAATATTAAAPLPPSMSRSTGSIATAAYSAAPYTCDQSGGMHRSVPSLESERRDSSANTHALTPLAAAHSRANGSSRDAGASHRRRSAPRVLDMTASYDFQREQAYNPFVSPPAAVREPLNVGGSGIETICELDLLDTSPITENHGSHQGDEASDERTRRGIERQSDTVDDAHVQRLERDSGCVALLVPETSSAVRLSDDDDETSALIAAIAAASQDDDDFDLFGTGRAS